MNYFKNLVLTLLLTISSVSNAAEVKMAKANWDTGYFQAEIYKQALEKMGYTVPELKAMKPSVFYLAAAAGDLDLWVNGWFGTHDGYLAEAKGKVKAVGNVMAMGGLQGYMIDKKTALWILRNTLNNLTQTVTEKQTWWLVLQVGVAKSKSQNTLLN